MGVISLHPDLFLLSARAIVPKSKHMDVHVQQIFCSTHKVLIAVEVCKHLPCLFKVDLLLLMTFCVQMAC